MSTGALLIHDTAPALADIWMVSTAVLRARLGFWFSGTYLRVLQQQDGWRCGPAPSYLPLLPLLGALDVAHHCRKVRYDAQHLPSHTAQVWYWSAAAISSTVHKAIPSYTSSWMPHAGVSGAVSPPRAPVRMLPRVPGFAPARAVPNECMQSLEQQLAASQQQSSLEKSIFYCTCQHLPCPSQPWTLLSGKSCT